MFLKEKGATGLEESLTKANATLPISSSGYSKSDADKPPEENRVILDEVENIDIDGQEQAGGVYVHRPGTGVPKTWESRKGRARAPDTEIYQEVDPSKEAPPTPKSSGRGGMFKMFRRTSKKGSFRDLDTSIPTSPGPQGGTELDPNLPRTPHPNVKELGEKRTSIKIVVNEDASKGDAENLTEDIAKVVEKHAGEPDRSVTSTLSRKISMKRQEDEGPVTIEGKPMDGHPTREDGNVQDVAVEAETTTQTS